jgi:hypothetical protein
VVGPAYQSVRRRFVSHTQALAGQVGWLSGLTATPGMLLQTAVLGLGPAVPFLGHRHRAD